MICLADYSLILVKTRVEVEVVEEEVVVLLVVVVVAEAAVLVIIVMIMADVIITTTFKDAYKLLLLKPVKLRDLYTKFY